MIFNVKNQEVEPNYSVESNLKSFKEEVLNELSRQHSIYGNIPLFFSGGMDSTFILRSLLELGIIPKLITFSYSEANDNYDSNLVKSICSKYNLDEPEFLYMDLDKLIEFTRNIIMDKNITYPVFQGYFMHYALSCFPGKKFYSGMGCEYKLYHNYIMLPNLARLIKQYNGNRLLDYTTSRTFLSYINHEKFISNYKKKIPAEYKSIPWMYIRDEIYLSCYPDMNREIKQFPFFNDFMDQFLKKIDPLVKALVNDNFLDSSLVNSSLGKFKFNVDKYFNQKIIQEK